MTQGNLAYKYDYRDERIDEKPKVKKENIKKKGTSIGYPAKIASVATVAVSAIFMIIQFVEVNETMSKLADTREQYAFEESVTSQKAFELEQSIDLSKIEKEASGRLGMRRPEQHQVVYLDVPQNDVTERTSGDVEGAGNRIAAFFKSLIGNIVEFFSI